MLIKPGSYPELQDSPRNPARQQIPSSKKGGYVSTVSPRITGFRGNSRRVISPIISPDPDSKPTISRTRLSTLNHRGKHTDRKGPDKPITRPSQRNKPGTKPGQKHPLEKKFKQIAQKSSQRESCFWTDITRSFEHSFLSTLQQPEASCPITDTSYLIFLTRTTRSSRPSLKK